MFKQIYKRILVLVCVVFIAGITLWGQSSNSLYAQNVPSQKTPTGILLDTTPFWYSDTEFEGTTSIALGDVDGDGDLDLAVGNRGWSLSCSCYVRGRNAVYENIDGTFETSPSWLADDMDETESVAWGDVDGDGDLDLAVGNSFATDNDTGEIIDGDNKVYENIDGVLQTTPMWQSRGGDTYDIEWGDVDGDGDLDLLAGNRYQNQIFENVDGELEAFASWLSTDFDPTWDIDLVDIDDDGDLDLVAGNGNGVKIYESISGVIETTASWQSPDRDSVWQLAFGDIDGDGDLDLVTGNANNNNKWYENLGGTLETTPYWVADQKDSTFDIELGDIDGDGDLDLVTGNFPYRDDTCNCYVDGESRAYENIGGTFETTPSWESEAHYYTYDVALGDIDGDGDLDFVAGNAYSYNEWYRNNAAAFQKLFLPFMTKPNE